jgi:DNA-binding GntR family transcriptional regulator
MAEKSVREDGSTLVDVIVNAIRKGIKEGRFVPGQRLVEADLTQQFDVSRGPLREAMRRLSSEGLVMIEPHKGAIVRKLSREDVGEIFTVRELLEGLAARLAAENITKGDNRKRMTAILREMQKHYDDNDIPAYMASNEKFHDLIVEISGNDYLRTLVSQLRIPLYRYQFHRLMDATSKRHSMADHKAIAAAILDGNPAKAERSMRKHVSNGRSFVETMAEM